MDLDIYNTDTLGLQLVKSLLDQIDADLIYDSDGGANFIIKFSENH
jgi:two-component sensor histidine kinase